MRHGGKRPGAGRPVGAKDKLNEERIRQIAESGVTPLAYMLGVLRDENADPADRKWAATAAAPYCHHKLSQVETSLNVKVNHEDQLRELE